MMNPITATAQTIRRRASRARRVFLSDVLAGLRMTPKQLPCKYFYDSRGSELFDRICQLDEYYLTRSELAIMDRFASEMGAQIGPGAMLVEYGSGSSVKTRYLLDDLPDAVAYVRSRHFGRAFAAKQRENSRATIRGSRFLPVCADFTGHFALPASKRPADACRGLLSRIDHWQFPAGPGRRIAWSNRSALRQGWRIVDWNRSEKGSGDDRSRLQRSVGCDGRVQSQLARPDQSRTGGRL